MKIAIASDHAGFSYKNEISEWLSENKHRIIDFGTNSEESTDYPDHAYPAAKAVSEGKADIGIIICGSGIGMSIVANKVKGIRAACCCTPEMAHMARFHNDANVLTFGQRFIDIDTAKKMTREFLETEFEGGRHTRRVDKIQSLTGC